MKRFGPTLLVCGLLAAVTVTVYWPVREHDFVNYDDPDYVTENSHVLPGFTRAGLQWAFLRLHGEHTYWHPVTWLSHMLDCQWFGLNPGAHHLVNLAFHVVNVALLFLVLKGMTGQTARSAVVAAFFAVHPLQVDTVAWISERKNLLSTLFFLLAIRAYHGYVRRRQGPEQGGGAAGLFDALRCRAYWLALLCFSLGLMSKPAVVTLPCVLLLLDYWPLRRWQLSMLQSQPAIPTRLVLEKLPFFGLALLVGVITIWAHLRVGSMATHEQSPWPLRLANAVVSYARYLQKTVWPDNLAVYYPYPTSWPAWQVLAAAALLVALTLLAFWPRPARPAVAVGWGWFMGTHLLTIGLLQVGAQAMADRFMYVPLIGLGIAMVWGVADFFHRSPQGRVIAAASAGLLIALAALTTRQQLLHWKNSVTLFEHALAVTEDNPTARNNLGTALAFQGRHAEAVPHFEAALRFAPRSPVAHCNLGMALEKLGETTQALAHYQTALELDPASAAAHFNLANALANSGRLDEAVARYQDALRWQPDYPGAHNNLAIALNRLRRSDEALRHVREALKLNPFHAEAWNNLGSLQVEQGDDANALTSFRRAVSLSPTLASAHHNLGRTLSRLGHTAEAIASLNQAVALAPGNLEAHYLLAELHAEAGERNQAALHLAKVEQLATDPVAAWSRLGASMAGLGRLAAATNCFHRALQVVPDHVEARLGLANALARMNHLEAAAQHAREASRLAPRDAKAQHALGRLLCQLGDAREASLHLRAAAELQPDWPEALNDAAWLLATAPETGLRDGPLAVRLALRANELTGYHRPNLMGTLAAAYAAAGQYQQATATAERAIRLAENLGLRRLADQTRTRLQLYQVGQPCIEEFRRIAP